MCAPVVAPAEDGDWLLRVGVHQINPDKNNLPDVLGGNVVLDKDETFTIDAEYMLTRNIGVDLFVPLYTSHDLQLKNTSLGNSAKIGETDLFAPILGLNWHFNVDGRDQAVPGSGGQLVGLLRRGGVWPGAVPANSRLEIDQAWGLAGRAGVDIGTSERWFLNLDVR